MLTTVCCLVVGLLSVVIVPSPRTLGRYNTLAKNTDHVTTLSAGLRYLGGGGVATKFYWSSVPS